MGYRETLRSKAWKDTWKLTIESPFITVLLSAAIFGCSALITYLCKGEKDMIALAEDAAIGLLSTAVVFGGVFLFHLLFLSPKHLYEEVRQEIEKYKISIDHWNEIFSPKLTLDCGPDVSGSKLATAWGNDFDSSFRVVINSKGYNPHFCRGNLIEISREGCVIFGGQEAKLTFATAGNYPSDQQLAFGIPAYLEIFGIKQGQLRTGTNHHSRSLGKKEDEELQKPGMYLAKIVVAANQSVSVGATLQFLWTGKFEDSSLLLLEQHSLMPPSPTPDKP
jgi:hypothetical protein